MNQHHAAIRMFSVDVLNLQNDMCSTKQLKNKIQKFKNDYYGCHSSMDTLLQILYIINNHDFLKRENGEIAEDARIVITETFDYSEEIFDLLCEKVRELVLMMRNADNELYSPLSIGSIRNVGMSLFRRIFFIANERAIRENSDGKIIYPYIVVDKALNDIMYNMFLHIFFSPCCDFLIPLYVFAAIPLCMKKDVVKFNRTYPVEGIQSEALNQFNLYGGVFNLKKNNPPNSKPYKYIEPEHENNE